MGISSLGACWAHASLRRRCRPLASCCARALPHESRAASAVGPGAGSLPFPTYRCGWESGVSTHPWQSGCVRGGQLCGDSQCLWGLGVCGRCVALAPDGAVGVGSVGEPRLGLAVRGWVTWRDLPAGQWIGLGSGRGLGTAAPPSQRPMPRERGRKCGHNGERGGSALAIRARRRQAMGGWHALGARAAAIRGDGLRPERGRHARTE